MKKLDINIVREEATAPIITNGDFDAVIVAVGKVPNTISVQGLDETATVQATDILLNKAEAGHNVVIIGSGTTGIETALYLEDKGHNVSVIEQSKNIKNHDQITYQLSYNQMLQERDIAIYVSTDVIGADQGFVKVVSKNGEETELIADTVVLATGYKANIQLAEELKGQTNIEVYHIGDSKEPGKIYDAIHSGYLTGLRL